MQIITREQWGARYEDGFGTAPLPAREVWLHHSVTIAPDLIPPFDDDDQAVRQLERIGEQRFGRGISYTFVVTPAGRVYEGHGVGRQGAHTAGRNSIARAVCMVGNYDTARPSVPMQTAVAELLVHGRLRGWWAAARFNGGHRQAPGASTACPGRHGMEVLDGINAKAAQLLDQAGPAAGPVLGPPPPPPGLPALPAWSLPGGHYYGNIRGPAVSHGGFYERERPAVRAIQARFVAAGCVPGVTWGGARADRWCDGRWDAPTDEACRRWFARRRPGQPFVTRVYRDDYAHL